MAETLQDALVSELLNDRRRERRWRRIRMLILLAIAALIIYSILTPSSSNKKSLKYPGQPYAAVVHINGEIMSGGDNSAAKLIPVLNRAFADKNSSGVLLDINSPGGSPVQASLIHDRLLYLKNKTHKKLVVYGEDSIASGAYLIATAADKIYVTPDTITGSIGVVMRGFGFDKAMKHVGISRRLFHAGANKTRLDPFQPLTEADSNKIQMLLENVHQNFINDVKQGRGKRLHGDPKELFSGDFWLGTQAVQLGLADGTADVWQVCEKEFHAKQTRTYSRRESLLRSVTHQFSTELAMHLSTQNLHLSEELQL